MILEETLNYVLEDDLISNDAKLIYSYLYSLMDDKRKVDTITQYDISNVINKSIPTAKRRIKELYFNNYITYFTLTEKNKNNFYTTRYIYVLPKLNIIDAEGKEDI